MRRIIFFGMNGEFSLITLRVMLGRGVNVCAIVAFDATAPADTVQRLPPQPIADLPLLPRNIVSLAHDHDIPAFAISSFGTPSFLSAFQPDLICVACFPKLFPRPWLSIPKLGCLNLHPSLLPNYRGIAPMFWQFYYGETRTGVTLHFMDAGADTGDIVAQAKVKFPEGITSHEVDRLTANVGAELLIEALNQNPIPRKPQPVRALHKLTPLPKQKDRLIPASWSVRRAFNFIRGADEWGPFQIEVKGKRIRVREAIRFTLGEKIRNDIEEKGGEIKIQFADGILIVR